MVNANTRPADVTTPPVLPSARMRPVCNPGVQLLFDPGDQQQVVVRPHRHQDDERERQYQPVQVQADQVLPHEDG